MAHELLPPGYTNASTKVFNDRGELFNGLAKTHHHYLKQLPPTGPSNPSDLPPDGTQVRQNFDDFVPFVTESAPPQIVKRLVVVGNFSGVRAARILHQYVINFWSNPEILSVLNNPAPVVYSQATLNQMYADFLLFNYLPDALTPTQDEFQKIVQPTGIFAVEIGLVPSTALDDTVVNDILLPPPIPFGESLTPFCQLLQTTTGRPV